METWRSTPACEAPAGASASSVHTPHHTWASLFSEQGGRGMDSGTRLIFCRGQKSEKNKKENEKIEPSR